MSRFYTLDADHNLVGTDDVLVWGKWFEEQRSLMHTEINGAVVSTIFVGMGPIRMGDREWGGRFFETGLLRDGEIIEEVPSRTWAEAELAHRKMLEKARL